MLTKVFFSDQKQFTNHEINTYGVEKCSDQRLFHILQRLWTKKINLSQMCFTLVKADMLRLRLGITHLETSEIICGKQLNLLLKKTVYPRFSLKSASL